MEVIRHGNLIINCFTNQFKKSNSYTLEIIGVEGVWLFDIGDSEELLTYISKMYVWGVFLTHSHFDHIYNIKLLQKHHPECIIYGSEKCIQWLSNDKRNLSFYYEHPLLFTPVKKIALSEKSIVVLTDNITVQVFETPGHNEDCLTYKMLDCLVTGDSYIPNVPPVTKLKGGDKEIYFLSLSKIKSLINSNTVLLPGHGPIFNNFYFSI